MKTILVSIFISVSSGIVPEKEEQVSTVYCMGVRDASLVMMDGKRRLMQDVLLDDGSLLKPDGVVVRKNGYRFLMNEHECIYRDGTVVGDDK